MTERNITEFDVEALETIAASKLTPEFVAWFNFAFGREGDPEVTLLIGGEIASDVVKRWWAR